MVGGASKRNSMNINQQIDEVFGEKLTYTHTHWDPVLVTKFAVATNQRNWGFWGAIFWDFLEIQPTKLVIYPTDWQVEVLLTTGGVLSVLCPKSTIFFPHKDILAWMLASVTSSAFGSWSSAGGKSQPTNCSFNGWRYSNSFSWYYCIWFEATRLTLSTDLGLQTLLTNTRGLKMPEGHLVIT